MHNIINAMLNIKDRVMLHIKNKWADVSRKNTKKQGK